MPSVHSVLELLCKYQGFSLCVLTLCLLLQVSLSQYRALLPLCRYRCCLWHRWHMPQLLFLLLRRLRQCVRQRAITCNPPMGLQGFLRHCYGPVSTVQFAPASVHEVWLGGCCRVHRIARDHRRYMQWDDLAWAFDCHTSLSDACRRSC